MTMYSRVVITRPEIQHRELKGTTAYIVGINTSTKDYAGYDPCMDGLPMFDLMGEDGKPIHSMVYQYEVSEVA